MICSSKIRVIKLKIIGLTENILKGRDDYGNVGGEGTPILNTDFEGLSYVIVI
jgi:hypothetical protein